MSLKVIKSPSIFVFQMLLVDCYKPNDVSAILNINSISNYLHYRQSRYSEALSLWREMCFFYVIILPLAPAGLCGGAAGEGQRDAETEHPTEERGADTMRSCQLLPPTTKTTCHSKPRGEMQACRPNH